MGRYYDMVKANYNKLRNDEAVMWGSINLMDELLEEMEKHHKERYWKILRDTHELIYGKHFNEEYAVWQVEKMHHKSPDGKEYKGEHWSTIETNDVFVRVKNKIPSEVTQWDFYVALNTQWHDYWEWAKDKFSTPEEAEMAIIDGAVKFWFLDDDWPAPDKVWCYFKMMAK